MILKKLKQFISFYNKVDLSFEKWTCVDCFLILVTLVILICPLIPGFFGQKSLLYLYHSGPCHQRVDCFNSEPEIPLDAK